MTGQLVSRTAGRRRRAAVWWAVLAGIALVASGFVVASQQQLVSARAEHSAAAEDYDTARDLVSAAGTELTAAEDSARSAASLAEEVLAVAVAEHTDPDTLTVLAAAAAALSEVDTAEAPRPQAPPLAEVTPTVEELDRETQRIRSHSRELRDAVAGMRGVTAELQRATDAVTAAGEAFMEALPGAAASVEERFISAANPARIAYRVAAESIPAGAWGADAPALVSSYVAAKAALAASHAAEEAEKAGPLYNARAEVEAFARSIAGGVMLDFDWAPIVNGYGANGSYGGTATWNTGHGGYSTITLSDSVAAQWHSNPAVASLVAHEVGHSITSKCMALFVDRFDSQPEVFATAWAIGLGYEREGNGESLYGRPSDELIELSRGCR